MTDSRTVRRQRTYKAGAIGFKEGRAVITCVIRNLSERGACLNVASPIGIPESFNLIFDSGEPSRVCQVIWRTEKQIGVVFK
jgi:hypothetical protein